MSQSSAKKEPFATLEEYSKARKSYFENLSVKNAEKLRREASTERKKQSEERKSAEIKATERNNKLDKGELIEGIVTYQSEVVPGIVSLNNSKKNISASKMKDIIASNRERYEQSKKKHPDIFSSKRRRGYGKRHKKRKTYKKKPRGHKKSRKH